MSARKPTLRMSRRARWIAAPLALLVAVGVVLLVVLHGTGGSGGPSSDAAATTPAQTAAAPSVSADPAPSDPSLGTTTPVNVPATVLADAPGLPTNLSPVALGSTSDYGNGVTARLVSVTAVTADAEQAGEISGPALAVAVELTNGTADPVSLDSAVVNAYSGADGTPAIRMHDGATQPLHGELAAGASMTATYVFSVPLAQRDSVTVTVAYGAGPGSSTAVFSGPVA
jgi:hypothetical protein